jgi:hypothetical protein
MHFREYNPSFGRWLSQEPLGAKADTNYYRYVHNRPLTFIDPNGRQQEPVFFGPGDSCSIQAQQVKEQCQASLNLATTASESGLLGACCGTGPGWGACAGIVTVPVGMAQIGGTLDCNAQATNAYNACEAQFNTSGTNPPKPDSGDYFDIFTNGADLFNTFRGE